MIWLDKPPKSGQIIYCRFCNEDVYMFKKKRRNQYTMKDVENYYVVGINGHEDPVFTGDIARCPACNRMWRKFRVRDDE